eukprot:scaffold17242_cov126-Isochrysis_galbana.AAC.6
MSARVATGMRPSARPRPGTGAAWACAAGGCRGGSGGWRGGGGSGPACGPSDGPSLSSSSLSMTKRLDGRGFGADGTGAAAHPAPASPLAQPSIPAPSIGPAPPLLSSSTSTSDPASDSDSSTSDSDSSDSATDSSDASSSESETSRPAFPLGLAPGRAAAPAPLPRCPAAGPNLAGGSTALDGMPRPPANARLPSGKGAVTRPGTGGAGWLFSLPSAPACADAAASSLACFFSRSLSSAISAASRLLSSSSSSRAFLRSLPCTCSEKTKETLPGGWGCTRGRACVRARVEGIHERGTGSPARAKRSVRGTGGQGASTGHEAAAPALACDAGSSASAPLLLRPHLGDGAGTRGIRLFPVSTHLTRASSGGRPDGAPRRRPTRRWRGAPTGACHPSLWASHSAGEVASPGCCSAHPASWPVRLLPTRPPRPRAGSCRTGGRAFLRVERRDRAAGRRRKWRPPPGMRKVRWGTRAA